MAAHGWQTNNARTRRRRAATALTLGVLTLLVLALAFGVSSAGAVVAKIGGHGYGITPINGADEAHLVAAYQTQHSAGLSDAPLARRYDVGPSGGTELFNAENGPVMHKATTHIIYWDPNKEFTSTTKGIVDGFFSNVAHDSGLSTNVFAVAGQYTDSTSHAAYSSTSTVSLIDAEKYPTGGCTTPEGAFADAGPPYAECMVDGQLQSELSRFITAEELPVGPTQLYFLLLPHKVATCLEEEVEFEPGVFEQACSNNVFCAYHSYIEPGSASEVIYADIPFSLLDANAKGCQDDGHAKLQQPNPDNAGGENSETRFADVALKYISHEYIEAVTDPLVNVETAWVDEHGLEIGDKCNGVHGLANGIGRDPNSFVPELGGSAAEGTLFNQSIDTGHYYLQSEWDNVGKACLMKPLAITAAGFTPTAESTLVGSTVNFNASTTDPYGQPSFAWDFGDGGTGNGPSPSHEYAAPGEYMVTMTPTDELTGSTAAPVQHTVIVKATQTISFTSTAPSSATVGGPAYTATATASSGLPVSFSSGTPSVCSVAGPTVSFAVAGTCMIDADQAGNTEFTAAPRMQQSFAVRAAATPPAKIASEIISPQEALTSGARAQTGTVALLSTNISIRANGVGQVKLSCTGTAACSGRLTLTVRVKAKGKGKHARTVTLAGASFSIAPGATGMVTLKLSAAGRSQLKAARGHLSAVLTIVKSLPTPASTQTRTVQLQQKRKK